MEYIALLILLVVVFSIVFIKQNKQIKSTAIKKEEIIALYQQQMIDILEKYKDNKELQIKEKIKLLKNINNELALNIFFDEQESKKILKDLTNLG